MTTLALIFPLVGAVFALAVALWHWLTKRAAKQIVEREMTKMFEQAKAEKDALPDPERPLDEKEVANALDKLRHLGRTPPE